MRAHTLAAGWNKSAFNRQMGDDVMWVHALCLTCALAQSGPEGMLCCQQSVPALLAALGLKHIFHCG